MVLRGGERDLDILGREREKGCEIFISLSLLWIVVEKKREKVQSSELFCLHRDLFVDPSVSENSYLYS